MDTLVRFVVVNNSDRSENMEAYGAISSKFLNGARVLKIQKDLGVSHDVSYAHLRSCEKREI